MEGAGEGGPARDGVHTLVPTTGTGRSSGPAYGEYSLVATGWHIHLKIQRSNPSAALEHFPYANLPIGLREVFTCAVP